MRIAITLYVIAACLLTAMITRVFIYQRIARRAAALIQEVPEDSQRQTIAKISLRLSTDFTFPCPIAFMFATLFFPTIYGAIRVHRLVSKGRYDLWRMVAWEMVAIFIVILILSSIAVPC